MQRRVVTHKSNAVWKDTKKTVIFTALLIQSVIMRAANWSLVLVTSIQVGSGPPNSSSLVSAQCPAKEEEDGRPSKPPDGSRLFQNSGWYQKLPYLELVVPGEYKWWEPPGDTKPLEIRFCFEDLDVWRDELGFFHVSTKLTMQWEDRRLFSSNMTKEVIDIPAEGVVWVPRLETNWKQDTSCRNKKDLKLFKNGSLSLSYELQAKKR